jgi:hypothetical protein
MFHSFFCNQILVPHKYFEDIVAFGTVSHAILFTFVYFAHISRFCKAVKLVINISLYIVNYTIN